MAGLSPMQRTLREQKKLGRDYGIVERFIHNKRIGPGIRSDLYGLFDVLCMSRTEGIIGIQCCGADFAAHYRKVTVDKAQAALTWLDSGGKIEIWSWRWVKEFRGAKRQICKPRVKKITYDDFELGYMPERKIV